ncbi:MAG: flagellar basal body rod protein [Candidatus Reconcilbacillus cellulovorans]|uniref:Flagellar basal body rod protein n=1 Tax=Candidatus Reconcilbacillus cellulovorans TaxID=1906605 RepID=A0A2A6E0M3_9BACL|nr:MAG: flagellar basal body rod protein [Candidatus Reconcilbacillus cellulovorans]
MLRGLYTAAAGMLAEQRRHQIVTNNVANLNTPGFKQSNAVLRSFPEMLIHAVGGNAVPAARPIGRLNTAVIAEENLHVWAQGDLEETGRPLDFALVSDIPVDGVRFGAYGIGVDETGARVFQPQAFFAVRNADGELRLTRNGRFVAGTGGRLTTPEGFEVLGRDGRPIVLPPGADVSQWRVTPDGRFVDASGAPVTGPDGVELALGLYVAEDPHALVREGDGVFRWEGDAALLRLLDGPEPGVEVRQGYLERSNVDAAQAMVELVAALRAFEANQKVVQAYDRSLEKAVNEVGRV